MPWGQKWPRPVGHMFYIGLYRDIMKNVLSDTTKPRALIFGMNHQLSVFKLCPKNDPTAGVT